MKPIFRDWVSGQGKWTWGHHTCTTLPRVTLTNSHCPVLKIILPLWVIKGVLVIPEGLLARGVLSQIRVHLWWWEVCQVY